MEIQEFMNTVKYRPESWFEHLWFPLFEHQDVLVTKEVLQFFYNSDPTFPLVKDDITPKEISTYMEAYATILNENEIKFKWYKPGNDFRFKFPYVDVDEEYEKWIIMSVPEFQVSLTFAKNKFAQIKFQELVHLCREFNLYYLNNCIKTYFKEPAQTYWYKKQNNKQVLYIKTNVEDVKKNLFTIGGVEHCDDVKKSNDGYYYVAFYTTHDYLLMEQMLSSYLEHFRTERKNVFKINFRDLKNFIKRVVEHMGLIKSMVESDLEYMKSRVDVISKSYEIFEFSNK